jgi:hypothetical protein
VGSIGFASAMVGCMLGVLAVVIVEAIFSPGESAAAAAAGCVPAYTHLQLLALHITLYNWVRERNSCSHCAAAGLMLLIQRLVVSTDSVSPSPCRT